MSKEEKLKDMTLGKIGTVIWEAIKGQGISVLLMAGGLYYLHITSSENNAIYRSEIQTLQTKIDKCTDERIDYYSNQTERLIKVIEANNAIMLDVKVQLESKK